jgi:hypothetical protein
MLQLSPRLIRQLLLKLSLWQIRQLSLQQHSPQPISLLRQLRPAAL